jgi:hypothetical protein
MQLLLTIAQASNSIECGHLYYESENIINESVESLVGHHAPRQMGYRFEFIVNKELRCHHNES